MNEELTKILTIALVFIVGMVSAAAVVLSTDDDGKSNEPQEVEPVNQAPVAAMYASSTLVYPGDEARFDASASTDTDGDITSYLFDFGDGVNADWQTEPTAEHIYSNIGDYTASLKVKDDDGNVSENRMEIVIVVQEKVPEEVITTSARSMDNFSEVFGSVESSPFSTPPPEESPVEEQKAPEMEIPDLPYEDVTGNPELPEASPLEFSEPEMDIEVEELQDANAGYDVSMEWEDSPDKFSNSLEGLTDSGPEPDELEKDPVNEFEKEFGTFKRHN
ncbi:MAG: PKD domain-containing protein, partial [Thermoplasmata archaeon]|nr:PKD domain-containing protein [Thermoplasmata archaeon]